MPSECAGCALDCVCACVRARLSDAHAVQMTRLETDNAHRTSREHTSILDSLLYRPTQADKQSDMLCKTSYNGIGQSLQIVRQSTPDDDDDFW